MRNFLSNRNNTGFDFFDRAFDDFFKPVFYTRSENMRTDIKETDKDFELSVDMPGFDKKDIELSLDNGYLTIQASRAEKEEEKDSFIRRERSFSCSRSYYVGELVTEEDIKARYVNGTLTLTVPKIEKKELPKRNIEIE
jgi:HSP20 family molecular chaperone IbpA